VADIQERTQNQQRRQTQEAEVMGIQDLQDILGLVQDQSPLLAVELVVVPVREVEDTVEDLALEEGTEEVHHMVLDQDQSPKLAVELVVVPVREVEDTVEDLALEEGMEEDHHMVLDQDLQPTVEQQLEVALEEGEAMEMEGMLQNLSTHLHLSLYIHLLHLSRCIHPLLSQYILLLLSQCIHPLLSQCIHLLLSLYTHLLPSLCILLHLNQLIQVHKQDHQPLLKLEVVPKEAMLGILQT